MKKIAATRALNNSAPILERINALREYTAEIGNRQLKLSGYIDFNLRLEIDRLHNEKSNTDDDLKTIIISAKISTLNDVMNQFKKEKEILEAERIPYQKKLNELEEQAYNEQNTY